MADPRRERLVNLLCADFVRHVLAQTRIFLHVHARSC